VIKLTFFIETAFLRSSQVFNRHIDPPRSSLVKYLTDSCISITLPEHLLLIILSSIKIQRGVFFLDESWKSRDEWRDRRNRMKRCNWHQIIHKGYCSEKSHCFPRMQGRNFSRYMVILWFWGLSLFHQKTFDFSHIKKSELLMMKLPDRRVFSVWLPSVQNPLFLAVFPHSFEMTLSFRIEKD
jgi:hypothetical protein